MVVDRQQVPPGNFEQLVTGVAVLLDGESARSHAHSEMDASFVHTIFSHVQSAWSELG